MPSVQFDWVNGGEAFDLPSLPIAGLREVTALKRKQAKLQSEWLNAMFLSRCMVMLETKRVLEKLGAEEAKKIWDAGAKQFFSPAAAEAVDYPVGEFAEKFDAWYEKECLRPLGKKTREEAVEEVTKRLEEVDMETINIEWTDHAMSLVVCEYYWRLKRAGHKTIVVDGAEVPLTKENLEQVIALDDSPTIRTGNAEVDWEEELAHHDEEAIKKKSIGSVTELTSASPALDDTSEPSSETATASSASAT